MRIDTKNGIFSFHQCRFFMVLVCYGKTIQQLRALKIIFRWQDQITSPLG